MTDVLQAKLAELPKEPGVYFHKDSSGQIIYVGKAAVLRNRVRQYFQASRHRDPKTEALIAEIVDVDWMVVESELEALFLEAEMVRRYMPRYNILLRDDKALSYIRIDIDSDYPTVTTTRRPLDDGARYFGPYYSLYGVKQALKLLRRIFPYATKRHIGQKRATLHYHLGLDPGLEEGKTSLAAYRTTLHKLIAVIEGKRRSVIHEVERDMQRAAKAKNFEAAARLRNQLFALQNLGKQVIFSDKEFLDIGKDHALTELVELLTLSRYPKRIEGYDISHMQGTNVVASMVVFTNGVSDKGEYRKFKTTRERNNDFANMYETIKRRLSETNVKKWGLPDIFLIDGGKGQLDAALRAQNDITASALIATPSSAPLLAVSPPVASGSDPDATGGDTTPRATANLERAVLRQGRTLTQKTLTRTPMIGLAKREEQIVIKKGPKGSGVTMNSEVVTRLGGYVTESDDFILINLPHTTNLVKLLQRVRDESHRFAVSYHTVLKRHQQTKSVLDDIPGVGPVTRKKLIKTFGSARGVMTATEAELTSVVGSALATKLRGYLSR